MAKVGRIRKIHRKNRSHGKDIEELSEVFTKTAFEISNEGYNCKTQSIKYFWWLFVQNDLKSAAVQIWMYMIKAERQSATISEIVN